MVGIAVMRKKCCPKCSLTSYSCFREVWICPYCNEDISKLPDYNISDQTDFLNVRDGEDEKKASLEKEYWI